MRDNPQETMLVTWALQRLHVKQLHYMIRIFFEGWLIGFAEGDGGLV
jgi:hypothetical protein